MTSAADLHREILRSPEDRDLRLVYADAVQDEGDEETAQFIRRTSAGEDVVNLPGSYKAAIGKCFGGAVPVWKECGRVMVGGDPIYSSVVGASTIFWSRGFAFGFRGPAVGGWDYLWRWLTEFHPIGVGHLSDRSYKWSCANLSWYTADSHRQVTQWSGRVVYWDTRELAARRELHSTAMFRRDFFRRAWPGITWTFEDET